MGNGLFLKPGKAVEANEILCEVPLTTNDLKHYRCPKQLQWQTNSKRFACAKCVVETFSSALCAVNCSTKNQNVYGKVIKDKIVWKFTTKLTGPIQIFDNYGFHRGHIDCRENI